MRTDKLIFLGVILIQLSCFGQAKDAFLVDGFKNPPVNAKPRTWMHAMSGNMSKEGLTKDLEAMSEAGLGGLLLFNITQGIPLGKVIYNSPDHHEMISHAAKEAERLGLSFGVHNCDGWSSSGGPWITPENSIKMVVWSEQIVQGGKKLNEQLKQPTTREGFYKDIAVLAYPSLLSELEETNCKPILSASDKNTDLQIINDGLRDKTTLLKGSKEHKPWIQFSYSEPFTARSAFVLHTDRYGAGKIYTSDDGENFTVAHELKPVRTGKGEWAMNDHFKAITAKHFRFVMDNSRGHALNIKEIELRSTYFYDNPLGRTSLARTELRKLDPIGTPQQEMIIASEKVRDLSDFMDANGTLKTKLPKGKWTILRFGYTSTGAFNNPASEEGRGLETDKLSKKATKIHFDAFCQKVVNNSKQLAPNALQYFEIDSYEMGGQNWTEKLDSIFKAKKGYDLIRHLPLYTGRFMNDAKSTEAILWDLRDVICNLMTENYFGYFTELCHQNGLQSYIEPYGFGPVNELEVGGKTDIPMGEFWMNRDMPMVPPAVSAAHIYGKPVISAESFTSTPEINWKGHPAMAKASGDKAWARGINEFMFHRFAHQANPNVVPGMTMNRWGFHFDRTQTWWDNAGSAWFKYIARGSFLLRQGVPVSDLLVFVGETAPNGTFTREDLTDQLPAGTNFDNVNADVLLNRITIKNRHLCLPEGTQYKALALKNNQYMSLELIKRLHQFSKQGITIIGPEPKALAGYGHTKKDKAFFKKQITEIWNAPNTFNTDKWQEVFSKQNIFPDLIIKDQPDLEFAHRHVNQQDIYFIYNPDSVAKTFDCTFRIDNKIPELWDPKSGTITQLASFYSMKGQTQVSVNMEREGAIFVVFRQASGLNASVTSLYTEEDKINVHAELDKNGVIYFQAAKNKSYMISYSDGTSDKIKVQSVPEERLISGPWEVQFNVDGGYGGHHQFDELTDWKDYPVDGIQHYSGTATYTKEIEIPADLLHPDLKVILDLGKVSMVAEVIVNGKNLGVLWKKPHKLDISNALSAGINRLEMHVTNQWSNRLIGDERYPANDDGYKLGGQRPAYKMPHWYTNNETRPAGKRTTFTTAPFYKKDDPLVSSGLVGPIKLSFEKIINIK